MSQNLAPVLPKHLRDSHVNNTSFNGGADRGVCLQLSQKTNSHEHAVVHLSKKQVVEQLAVMTQWLADQEDHVDYSSLL